MTNVTGLILAAGRGSRMKGLTKEKPKCLLELAGHPLLYWQLQALRAANISRIVVVRGYRAEMLSGDFETVDNPRWDETNMVQTLLCALPKVEDSALIAYADIVYRSEHVRKLLQAQGDICLTYDTQWQELWGLRNENPLDDAETFREEKGQLREIGGKPQTLDDVHGQYMGLLKCSPEGLQLIKDYVSKLPQPFADRLDMTSLLRGLLANKVDITAVPVSGGWCECDTEADIICYEKAMCSGSWAHDWRNQAS